MADAYFAVVLVFSVCNGHLINLLILFTGILFLQLPVC
jgi:hypothetical protein